MVGVRRNHLHAQTHCQRRRSLISIIDVRARVLDLSIRGHRHDDGLWMSIIDTWDRNRNELANASIRNLSNPHTNSSMLSRVPCTCAEQ
eukprot:638166-Rhodomonas_salina.2